MDNEAIARRFAQLAALMEFRGDDPFRLRSYRNAAEAIDTWPVRMMDIDSHEGVAGMQSVRGVGEGVGGESIEQLQGGREAEFGRVTSGDTGTGLDMVSV